MLQKQNYRMTQKPAPQNVSRSEIGVLKKQWDPCAHCSTIHSGQETAL